VALADKLWEGKREADIEISVIDEVAERLGIPRWYLFQKLDTAFEDIPPEAMSEWNGPADSRNSSHKSFGYNAKPAKNLSWLVPPISTPG
jgi:hypothetical protein